MKAADYRKELRNKSKEELKEELVTLLKEQFNLRMKKSTGNLNQQHLLRQVRRNIARVKTVFNEKAGD